MRLMEQIRDYFIITLILSGVAMLGQAKMEVAAHHGGGRAAHAVARHVPVHVESHAIDDSHARRALEIAQRALSGHEVEATLDLQARGSFVRNPPAPTSSLPSSPFPPLALRPMPSSFVPTSRAPAACRR